jgi:DNA polymerase III subunits gamma and tau domain III.
MVLIKVCGKEIVSDLSDGEKDELEKISADESVETLEILFKLMLEGAEEVQKSFYPQMALEATLVKLTLVHPVVSLDDILGRIEALSGKIGSGNPPSQQLRDSQRSQLETREKPGDYNDSHESTQETSSSSEISGTGSSANSNPKDFISFVKSKKPITGKGLEHADKVGIDESIIRIEFSSTSIHSDHLLRQDAQKNLRNFAKEFFNRDLTVKVEINPQSKHETDHQSLREQSAKIKEEMYEDQVVQDALTIFGGRIVKIKTKE